MTRSTGIRKAIICVFDGLRPDRVTPDLMPNLWRFANAGIWFRESRSVLPSVTRVATASFATGAKPRTHGIMNNAFFHPAVIADRLLDTSSAADLRAAEAHHGGRFVEADGLGCALARASKSFAVVHTGSSGSAYLVNHKAAEHGHWTFSIHGRTHTQTPAAVDEVIECFGPLPESTPPKFGDIDYGADVFIDLVLAKRQPDVALIWFSEPDTAYHYCDIGSEQAIAISRRVDEQFGRILEAIDRGPDAAETLIVAMSDHGQITTAKHVDVPDLLRDVGITASHRPSDDVDAVVTLGIALNITLTEKSRLRDGGAASLGAIAERLMAHPGVGHLFSRDRNAEEGIIKGTLPFSAVGIDHARAADLVCILRSSTDPDCYGLSGTAACSSMIDVPLGGGMHGGLSPEEQNTMLAFGGAPIPTLGAVDDPADLTDIVPTVLSALALPIPDSVTGSPLAAVIGQERPALSGAVLSTGRGDFEQSLSILKGGPHPVIASGHGGRTNSAG